MINNRVLVPVRGIMEALGAKVEWFPDTKTVVATTKRQRIVLNVGYRLAQINNQYVMLEQPLQMIYW